GRPNRQDSSWIDVFGGEEPPPEHVPFRKAAASTLLALAALTTPLCFREPEREFHLSGVSTVWNSHRGRRQRISLKEARKRALAVLVCAELRRAGEHDEEWQRLQSSLNDHT